MDLAHAFAVKAGLTNIRPLAQGLEFNVYRATSPAEGDVVLRVPKHRVFCNANDANIDARDLVRQEAAILHLLRTANTSVPVPRCYGYHETDDGYPAMVCEYMPDDGVPGPADDAALGRIAALIHATPVPADWDVQLVAMEGHTAAQLPALFLQRMRRRFAVLGRLAPQTRDWAPDEATLRDEVAAPLLARLAPALLHMDLRHCNVRLRAGRVSAVFDWTNALLAPPVVDVYRSLEWGAQPAAFLAGYRSVGRTLAAVSEREEALLRLDAALVLALVFVSEAPDPDKSVAALRRVQELCEALRR